MAVTAVVARGAFCGWLCPLGATVSLLGRLSPLRIERAASACTSCGLCTQRCPMGIDVARADAVTDLRAWVAEQGAP